MSYNELALAQDDVDFRQVWKTAKAKHQATLTARKIKFGSDLGTQLDKLHRAHQALSTGYKMGFKRNSLTDQESKETDPKKRKATRAKLIANDKANQVLLKAKFKSMLSVCNSVALVADDYKDKIAGLGEPAKRELTVVLDAIIRGVGSEQIDVLNLQAKFSIAVANPNRLDDLK